MQLVEMSVATVQKEIGENSSTKQMMTNASRNVSNGPQEREEIIRIKKSSVHLPVMGVVARQFWGLLAQ